MGQDRRAAPDVNMNDGTFGLTADAVSIDAGTIEQLEVPCMKG